MATSFDKRLIDLDSLHDITEDIWLSFSKIATLPDCARILDLGCGYGAGTREIINRRDKDAPLCVDLLDESSVQLEEAERRLEVLKTNRPLVHLEYLQPVRVADNVPLKNIVSNRLYDAVLLKMVLHELPKKQQPKLLEEVYEVLKPDGYLVLWDICLPNKHKVASFIRKAIRRKDKLAKFDTLLKRRYLQSANAFEKLLNHSPFVMKQARILMHYKLQTQPRLSAEFDGDETKLQEWNKYIREQASMLSNDDKNEIKYSDDGSDNISFMISKYIVTAYKPSILRFIFRPVPEKQGRYEQSYNQPKLRCLVGNALAYNNFEDDLATYKGLVRVSYLPTNKFGKREPSKEGLDYLYNYNELDTRKISQAYLTYLAWAYGQLSRDQNIAERTITGFLAEMFKSTCCACWLRVLDETDYIEFTIGTYLEFTVQINMKFSSFPEQLNAILERTNNVNIIIESLCEHSSIQSITVDGKSADDWAENEGMELLGSLSFEYSPSHFESIHSTEYIKKLEKHGDLFIPLIWFMREAKQRAAYYLLPSTLVEDCRRVDEGAFFISSSEQLSPQQLQTLLSQASGIWAIVGTLEGQKLIQRNQQLAVREMIHADPKAKTWFASEIFFPLWLGQEEIVRDLAASNASDPINLKDHFDKFRLMRMNIPELFEKYLKKRVNGFTSTQLDVLNDLKHQLAQKNIHADNPDLYRNIHGAWNICKMEGTLLDEAAQLLNMKKELIEDNPEDAVSKVVIAREIIESLMRYSREPLRNLCKSVNPSRPEAFDFDYGLMNCEGECKPYAFVLSELILAINVLTDNATTTNDRILKYSELQEDTKTTTKVTWIERVNDNKWEEWNSLIQFKEKARISVAKGKRGGVNRGLPKVLLFGLENDAQKIDVMFSDIWYRIWPLDDNNQEKDNLEFGEKSYGIRFTFF